MLEPRVLAPLRIWSAGTVIVAVFSGCSDPPSPEASPKHTGPATIVQVDVGSDHACARYSDGSMRCWGMAIFGALGGPQEIGQTIVDVTAASGSKQVRAYGTSTCALVADGTVRCWGNRKEHESTDTGSSIESFTIPGLVDVVSLGYQTAAHANGGVSWWGFRFGFDHSAEAQSFFALEDVVELPKAPCARTADGIVHCWGSNTYGQVGDGTLVDHTAPIRVLGLESVVQVDGLCGTRCALRRDETLWCWGGNDNGQMGDGTVEEARVLPAQVPALGPVSKVAVGCSHVCTLMKTGAVHCWGEGTSGELGDGQFSDRRTVGEPVVGISDGIDVAAGSSTTCVIRANDTVWCWGYSTQGVLGKQGASLEGAPVQVDL